MPARRLSGPPSPESRRGTGLSRLHDRRLRTGDRLGVAFSRLCLRVNHTIMVTLVGQEILRGRHISVGSVTPRDWLHFTVALLCHDIGYVRGICRGDGGGQYVINFAGDKVTVPEGATDAAMTPYHIPRSQLLVRERFSKAVLSHLDTEAIEAYIEHPRFPVPEEEQHAPTDCFPGMLRAADLIGQLADINYLRKTAALFTEFRETGISQKLNLTSAVDLRATPAILLEDGTTLSRGCVALPARHAGGPTVDC
jgi:hypothetical protein